MVIKWIRARVPLRFGSGSSCRFWSVVPNGIILRVRWYKCGTLWVDSTAMVDEMGVGGWVFISIQMINHDHTALNTILL